MWKISVKNYNNKRIENQRRKSTDKVQLQMTKEELDFNALFLTLFLINKELDKGK